MHGVTLQRGFWMAQRTADVESAGAQSFDSLCLPRRIVQSLRSAGYAKPSPIQEKAIPLVRLGGDVIVQAKAGTGKTLVFAVAAAECIDPRASIPQVLLLAPTREIALQASDVAMDVSQSAGYSVVTCIGGLPTVEDERLLRRGCHLVVGTTGRIKSLIERKSLILGSLKMVVLDEADRLLSDSFYQSVQWIMDAMPEKKQVLALSATFDDVALERVKSMMKNRIYEIQLSRDNTSLLGVEHYYLCVGDGAILSKDAPPVHDPNSGLVQVLGKVPFRQAIVFCSSIFESEAMVAPVKAAGFAAGCLSSDMEQLARISVLNDLRCYRLRVLVCTDIAARGIDLDHVDLVINMNIPPEPATIAHRIGRAGRFGGRGIAVSILKNTEELSRLCTSIDLCHGSKVCIAS